MSGTKKEGPDFVMSFDRPLLREEYELVKASWSSRYSKDLLVLPEGCVFAGGGFNAVSQRCAYAAKKQEEPKPDIQQWPKRATDEMGFIQSLIAALLGMAAGALLVGFAWHLSARHTPNQADINPATSPASAPIRAHDRAVLLDDESSRSNLLRSNSYSNASLKGSPSLIFDSSRMMEPSSRDLAPSNQSGVSIFACSWMSRSLANLIFCSCDKPLSSTSSRYMERPLFFQKTLADVSQTFKPEARP